MEGIISQDVYYEDLAISEGTRISFDIDDFKGMDMIEIKLPTLLSRDLEASTAVVPTTFIMVREHETLQDTGYILNLADKIEQHDRILVVDIRDYHRGFGKGMNYFYLFDEETPSTKIAKERSFDVELAKEIALNSDSSLKVYVLEHNRQEYVLYKIEGTGAWIVNTFSNFFTALKYFQNLD